MDPFAHLPHLRTRLMPPEASALRLTTQHLAEWDRRMSELGLGPDWRLADDAREASRRAFLGPSDAGEDLWIFAYGSLMWDPGIRFAEVRLAELDGAQRRFTYRAPVGRGTSELPALMLALERKPGVCRGLAFRVHAAEVEAESEILWRREMLRGGYAPAMLPLETPQGAIDALVFAANHAHADYVGEQPLEQTAATIAAARGPLGTNREYLEQVAAQLLALGIEDDYIAQLLHRVQAGAGG